MSTSAAAPPIAEVPPEAWALGPAREARHDPVARTVAGAWFTPQDVARRLAAVAAPSTPPRSVLDPACGGGAFLLAAAERWPDATLHGVDLDPASVDVAREAVRIAGRDDHHIAHADGLLAAVPPADLVLGNPPFLSQLQRGTARDADRRRALADRFGPAANGYVDEAALFVLATARHLLAPGGTAVLVVPEALLATADAGRVRAEVSARCTVEVVWRDVEGVFPGVPTCAIRLRRRPRAASPADGWAALLADGVPRVTPSTTAALGDIARATADFRDAYYLLADHVHEHDQRPDGAPLVTVGLIDPAHLRWGEAGVRFAKRRWDRPVVADLPGDFLAARTGPKVVVATQTRVLEAVVDAVGATVPSTPAITVRTDRPWHVGAALTSPVASAVAARRHAGAARSRGALKLAARQLLALPVPPGPSGAWDDAAQAYRDAHRAPDPDRRHRLLLVCARRMCAAHDVADDGDLLAWWTARLPRR